MGQIEIFRECSPQRCGIEVRERATDRVQPRSPSGDHTLCVAVLLADEGNASHRDAAMPQRLK